MRAVYKALQTQAFLQRNEADIRKVYPLGCVSRGCVLASTQGMSLRHSILPQTHNSKPILLSPPHFTTPILLLPTSLHTRPHPTESSLLPSAPLISSKSTPNPLSSSAPPPLTPTQPQPHPPMLTPPPNLPRCGAHQREMNHQLGIAHVMHVAGAGAGHAAGARAVEEFLGRYDRDLHAREERKLKLVEKVLGYEGLGFS
jgi:hypothetical protein